MRFTSAKEKPRFMAGLTLGRKEREVLFATTGLLKARSYLARSIRCTTDPVGVSKRAI